MTLCDEPRLCVYSCRLRADSVFISWVFGLCVSLPGAACFPGFSLKLGGSPREHASLRTLARLALCSSRVRYPSPAKPGMLVPMRCWQPPLFFEQTTSCGRVRNVAGRGRAGCLSRAAGRAPATFVQPLPQAGSWRPGLGSRPPQASISLLPLPRAVAVSGVLHPYCRCMPPTQHPVILNF